MRNVNRLHCEILSREAFVGLSPRRHLLLRRRMWWRARALVAPRATVSSSADPGWAEDPGEDGLDVLQISSAGRLFVSRARRIVRTVWSQRF
jgi:hypothetical protein